VKKTTEFDGAYLGSKEHEIVAWLLSVYNVVYHVLLFATEVRCPWFFFLE